MTEKDIIKVVDSLTQDEKLDLWLKYVVEIATLNNDYKVSEGKQNKGTYYSIMNLTTWKYMEGLTKHKVTPFDNWLKQDKNNHDLTGIYAFYRRYVVNKDVKWDRYGSNESIKVYKAGTSLVKIVKNESNKVECKNVKSYNSSNWFKRFFRL